MKAVCLISSGLDSVASLAIASAKYDVQLGLTFDYGQLAADAEIERSRQICAHYGIPHRVISLDWMKDITTTSLVNRQGYVPDMAEADLGKREVTSESAANVWVPNRNGLMANIAAAFAEAMDCGYIIAGFNAEEAATFPDNSPEFVDCINRAFSYSTLNGVRLISPVLEMDKVAIVKEAIREQAPLGLSWSCYQGKEKPCGVCESCVRRARAFREAGIKDPAVEDI
ncbi:7-cyano-7-deazaguanine synthase QueC [Methanohalophilus profundi]|uniref:7-cyano-7-deazaguanine synthase QueC n=1 Tax=Methanohalophilus profundi TaxID=2138083 RepID=UPI00101C69E4|nr:7-cyano-7-deazaguanine synthase QueC [Methanohalophilus profundi]